MLKKSIHDASRAALQPIGGLSYSISDLRFIHNLRKLLDAAKQFHTSASSTAGSTREGTAGPWVTGNALDSSEIGEFPANRRRWVENYVRAGRDQGVWSPDSQHAAFNTQLRAMSPQWLQSSPKVASLAETESIDSHLALYEASPVAKEQSEEKIGNMENLYDDDDDCDDAEAEQGFQQRLQSLAKDMIRRHDYRNAIDFLHKALQSGVRTAAAKAERRQLQIQLTICHFLQGDWEQAEVSINCLSKARNDRDAVVCTLLHALALAHLLRYSFDMALSIGQRALQGRKRLLLNGDIDGSDVDETRALLATIYNVRGGNDDYIRADVFREQISKSFTYTHPRNEVTFIKTHPTLLSTVIGSDIPASGRRPLQDPDLPAGIVPRWKAGWPNHTLSRELAAHERYKQDTEKHVISSPMQTEQPMSPQVVAFPPEPEASRIAATPTTSTQPRLERLTTSGDREMLSSHENTPDSGASSSANVLATSRWLRVGSALGLRKHGIFPRKTPSQKRAPKRSNGLRSDHQWLFRRKTTRKTNAGSEQQVHCDSTGHRVMEWDRTQPRDIDACSMGSDDSGRGNLLVRPRSEAGGSMVSQLGCYIGTSDYPRPDEVPFVPRSVSYESAPLADHHMFRLGSESTHEMDGTQIAVWDNADAPELNNNPDPGMDDLLDPEMSAIRVYEINNLNSATELSGTTTAEVEILSKHNRFGCDHHGSNITSAEPETVASFANPRHIPRSSAPELSCLPPIPVGTERSIPEVCMNLVESTIEKVDDPLPALRNTQSATKGPNPPVSLPSPLISSIAGGLRHGECLTTMRCPNQPPMTNTSARLLSVRPTVIDSGDNRRPEPSSYAPRLTHLKGFHGNQILVDNATRVDASPEGSYIVAAEEASHSRCTTIVADGADSGEVSETSAWVLEAESSPVTPISGPEIAILVAPGVEEMRQANTLLHMGGQELAISPKQHVSLSTDSDTSFSGNCENSESWTRRPVT